MMGLIVPVSRIQDHFASKLDGLPHSPETVAYVVGVLGKKKWAAEDDLSRQSILLAYMDAMERGDFITFQRIGDWVLFIDSVMPNYFEGTREFVENVGRLSYLRCFRLMGNSWRVYEELADELPKLVVSVRRRLA